MFTNESNDLIIRIYVDNLVIMGLDLGRIKALKAKLLVAYLVKDLGEIKFYLGLNIVRDRKVGTMTIN
jgi:hypothetical protein